MGSALPGLSIALCCALIAQIAASHLAGLSPLIVALLMGIAGAHAIPAGWQPRLSSGLYVSRGLLLRTGIVLYGLNVSVQQILQVGLGGIVVALAMVAITLTIGFWVGHKIVRLDRQTSLLIACGSAICGAAAVAAVEPVIKAPAYKIAIAVATVVIYGTISMVVYPALQYWLGLSDAQYGLWVGASVHEVAQVVVAGASVSEQAQNIAVTEKMLRVILLAPVLIILMLGTRTRTPQGASAPLHFPWFALGFILVIVANSFLAVPSRLHGALLAIDSVLLSMAMFALGTITHIAVIRQAGARALALGGILLLQLVGIGLLLSYAASALNH